MLLTLVMLFTSVAGAQAGMDGGFAQLPANVKTIEEGAFENDKSLICVVIPNGATAIESRAFANCSNLEEVVIPPSVTSIATDAFTGCPEWMTVYCEFDSEPFYWVLEQEDFYVATGMEQGPLNIYVRQEWLDKMGCDMPQTFDQLCAVLGNVSDYDLNGNGKQDELSLTAFYEDYFFMKLSELNPELTDEKITLLIVSGELGKVQATTRPFDANAFAIISDVLPDRVADQYTKLVFPEVTATPAPTATAVPGLRQLAAPTELVWGRYYASSQLQIENMPGMLSWRAADENADLTYKHQVKVYCQRDGGDELVWDSTWRQRANAYAYKSDHDFVIHSQLETGNYYYTVQALGDGESCTDSEIVTSSVWSYVRPAKQLDAPVNPEWAGVTEEGAYAIAWDMPSDENVGGYIVTLYYSATDGNATDVYDLDRVTSFVRFLQTDEMVNSGGFNAENFDEPGYYYFDVQYVSRDIGTVLHSDNSVISEPWTVDVDDADPTPTAAPSGEKKAYINHLWLEQIGWDMPADENVLFSMIDAVKRYDPNGDGEWNDVGIAAASYNDFYIAFNAVGASYDADTLLQMIAAGLLSNFAEGDDPFACDALVVVAESLPAEYAAIYSVLTAGGQTSIVTPTASPAPTASPDKAAYISQVILDELGLEMPATLDEFIAAHDAASSNGILAGAAQSYNEFYLALEAYYPDSDDAMLQAQMEELIAAGVFWNIIVSDTPLDESAMIVITDEAEKAYELGYVRMTAASAEETPAPSAAPSGEKKAYVNAALLAQTGLETPTSVEELMKVLDEGNKCGIVTIAGESMNDFYLAFSVFDSTYTADKVVLMLAAEKIENWKETTNPLEENAMIVITDDAAAALEYGYEELTAPEATVTPTPAPTTAPSGRKAAYVHPALLAELGLETPTTMAEMFEALSYAEECGFVTLAAESIDDFHLAFETLEDYDANTLNLKLASGEIGGWEETTDPLDTGALYVITTERDMAIAYGYTALKEEAVKKAYIHEEMMEMLGLEMPTTIDELMSVFNTAVEVGLYSIAGESKDDFYIAFQAIDPSFEKEKVMLMIAAEQLEGWVETDAPLESTALVVIMYEDEITSSYIELGASGETTPAPVVTPTPTTAPTGEKKAYIDQNFLDQHGFATPSDMSELFEVLDYADDNGYVTIAAESEDDFYLITNVYYEDVEVAKAVAMEYMAAGMFTGYVLDTDTLSHLPVVAITTEAAYAYEMGYVELTAAPAVTPTPAPTTDPSDTTLKAYIHQYMLAELGLEMPTTTDELRMVINAFNNIEGWYGIAAQEMTQYYVAFAALDSSVTSDQVLRMIEEGSLASYTTAEDPFAAPGVVVVASSLPEEYASLYVQLGSAGEPALPQLAAPTELEWGKYYGGNELLIENMPGMIAYRAADANAELTYEHCVSVYRQDEAGDKRVWKSTWTQRPSSNSYRNDHDFVIHEELESGNYYFTVQALGDGETCTDSEIATSAVWTYVKPDEQLAAPTGLAWAVGDEYTVTWDAPSDARVGGYLTSLYYSETDAFATDRDTLESVDGFVRFFEDGATYNSAVFYRGDFERAGYYYFTVQHMSGDIGSALHSNESVLSAAYAHGVAEPTASPEPEVTAEPTLRQLAAPTNLEWGKFYNNEDEVVMDNYPGMISWCAPDANMDISHKYEYTIYHVDLNGVTREVYTSGYTVRPDRAQHCNDWDFVNNGIDTSGDYYFTVRALGDDTTTLSSEPVTSPVWSYTVPDRVLAAPTGLYWDGTTARWNASTDELAGGYTVSLYYSADNANAASTDELDRVYGFLWYFAEGYSEPEFEYYEEEFAEPGYYYFAVETVSANVEIARHSEQSALSPAYVSISNEGTTADPAETTEPTETPTATPTVSPTMEPDPTPTPEPTTEPELAETPEPDEPSATAKAWINLEWLEATGWSREDLTQATYLIKAMSRVSEEGADFNGNGVTDEIGIAAASTDDFLIALQTVQPSFQKELLDVMLMSGSFCKYAVSNTPFEENAMVVVWPELPDEYANIYSAL